MSEPRAIFVCPVLPAPAGQRRAEAHAAPAGSDRARRRPPAPPERRRRVAGGRRHAAAPWLDGRASSPSRRPRHASASPSSSPAAPAPTSTARRTARAPPRGGRGVRAARAHAERLLPGRAVDPARAEPAELRLAALGGRRGQPTARHRGLAASVESRARHAQRRAQGAAARRPCRLRLDGRCAGRRPRGRPRAARPQRRRRGVLRRCPSAPGAEQVVFFGQFGYEPNRARPRALRRRGLARGAAPAPAGHSGGGRAPGWSRRCAGASTRCRGSACSASSTISRDCWPPPRTVVVPLWVGGGTRLKVLEALAAARPVVGTAVGVEELGFTPGVHGLVGESPHALAAAVAELLADPGRAAEMGAAGRELAGDFRWPRALAAAGDAPIASTSRPPDRTIVERLETEGTSFGPLVPIMTLRGASSAHTDKWQTRRKAGTQSHGTTSSGVSRATERGTPLAPCALHFARCPYLVLAAAMFPATASASHTAAGHARVAIDSASHDADFSQTAARAAAWSSSTSGSATKMLALKRGQPGHQGPDVQEPRRSCRTRGASGNASTGVTTQDAAAHPEWFLLNRVRRARSSPGATSWLERRRHRPAQLPGALGLQRARPR